MSIFSFLSSKTFAEGTSRFAHHHFQKSVILASCNLAGRPFVACHAEFFVIFPWFLVKSSISISPVDF